LSALRDYSRRFRRL